MKLGIQSIWRGYNAVVVSYICSKSVFMDEAGHPKYLERYNAVVVSYICSKSVFMDRGGPGDRNEFLSS